MYGYFPNAVKTSLVVKEPMYSAAVGCFEGTGVIITSVGKRHLGAAIGTDDFVEDYVLSPIPMLLLQLLLTSSSGAGSTCAGFYLCLSTFYSH